MLEELLSAAPKTLESLEVDSKIIPVFGRYIEAAAHIGSTLLEITEVIYVKSFQQFPLLMERCKAISKDGDMVTSLASHISNLTNLLEQLQEQSAVYQGEGLMVTFADLQRQAKVFQVTDRQQHADLPPRKLQLIRGTVGEWYSGGLFPEAFLCLKNAEGPKRCEGLITKVLEEIQVSHGKAPAAPFSEVIL